MHRGSVGGILVAMSGRPEDKDKGDADAERIKAMVAAKDAATHEADREQADRDRRRAARFTARPARVRVDRGGKHPRVVIERKLLVDQLLGQIGWGYVFPCFLGGWVVVGVVTFANSMSGRAGGSWIAVAGWAVVLGLINLFYAWLARPRYTFDVTEDDGYVLYTRSVKHPLMLGRLARLKIKIFDYGPALLGRAKFENDDTEEYVEKLTTADLHILREAVPRRCIH